MVFGEIEVPGATRTILFYCHYDGQPADPSRWVGHAPWEPVLRDGTLESAPETFALPPRARSRTTGGSTPARPRMTSRRSSRCWRRWTPCEASGLEPTSNLKFIFEGDEEAGSPNLDRMVREHADLLAADIAVIADGPRHDSGRPTACSACAGS